MGNTLQTPPRIPPPTQHEKEVQYLKENEFEYQEFTCEICIEPTSNPENKFKNADKCSHPFCTNCIINYIRVKLEDYNMGQIKCPALNCDQGLGPLACAQLVGPQLFLRWSDVLCEATIMDYDKCYCPYRNCSALIVDECWRDQKKSECPSCKRLFCFKCRRVWHAGFKCEESEELRDENEVAFGRLAEEKKWMRCPRCKHFVELIKGCTDVRCGCCFCYICGNDFLRCCCKEFPWHIIGACVFYIILGFLTVYMFVKLWHQVKIDFSET